MTMKWKLSVRNEIKVVAGLTMVAMLIAFTERRQDVIVCKNMIVEIENDHENYFLDQADVVKLVGATHANLIGTSFDHINLREIEGKLLADKHLLDAQLFGDLKGNLVVRVDLRRPLARIVRPDAPDVYIAEDGIVMPVSEKYTSRVVLISGAFADKLVSAGDIGSLDEGEKILELLGFISDDNFWRSQVAQLDIDETGEITIYPQVTGQRVEFGKAEDVERKFGKLMIFYKRILPQRGWTKYERVNLKYEGQVMAE